MEVFYFTYGLEDYYPWYGGWTEIEAPDKNSACELFRAFHPDHTPGFVNCAFIYPEEAFLKTEMAGPKGNFGARCRERITVTRVIN